MKESEGQPKKMSTCFEGAPCAEMMQKITSGQGIGSLCEEMMRSLIEKLDESTEKSRKTNKKGDLT